MAAYDCIRPMMQVAYGAASLNSASGEDISGNYGDWERFSMVPYPAATHGGRYVSNYANGVAADAYRTWEEGGPMPAGSVLAKDSFTVSASGEVAAGPLFAMEKMASGFDADSGDWRYSMVTPGGAIVGQTGGVGSDKVAFCIDCHLADGRDSMFFLPPEFRIN
jgi:hypothetical protein